MKTWLDETMTEVARQLLAVVRNERNEAAPAASESHGDPSGATDGGQAEALRRAADLLDPTSAEQKKEEPWRTLLRPFALHDPAVAASSGGTVVAEIPDEQSLEQLKEAGIERRPAKVTSTFSMITEKQSKESWNALKSELQLWFKVNFGCGASRELVYSSFLTSIDSSLKQRMLIDGFEVRKYGAHRSMPNSLLQSKKTSIVIVVIIYYTTPNQLKGVVMTTPSGGL